MYKPSEDSLLLAESVKAYRGTLALEIGVGSGELLKVLCQNFRCVIGTDIDLISLKYCRDVLPSSVVLICCDASPPLRMRFDIIVSNPPYLPMEDTEELDTKIHGGVRGIETTLHFLESAIPMLAENGKVLIVASSLSDYPKLLCRIEEFGLLSRELRRKRLFFETLVVLEIGF